MPLVFVTISLEKAFAFSEHSFLLSVRSLPPSPRPPRPTAALSVDLAGARPKRWAEKRRPSLHRARHGGGGGSDRPGLRNFESMAGER